jgi:hypothetical protein
MKASMTTLVAVLTIGSLGLAASSALACHGGGYGGGYSSNYYPSTEYVREVYVQAPTFAPGHSLIVVLPGDSWFSISSREYGNSGVWSRIAEFNGMPQNLPLTVGMQLRLPVINPNGSLSLSSAPAMIAQGFNGGFRQGLPQGFQQGIQQGNLPQGFAQGGMPQGAQFGPQNGMPQGGQFGQQGGLPQGGQFGQPNGLPQGNGFAPQGQGFAPPQGQMGMQQGNLPQGGQFGPQGQQFAPQGNNLPQGQPLGAQGGLPQGTQGPQAGPQGSMNLPQGEQVAPQANVEGPQADAVGQIVAKVGELAGQALAGAPQVNEAPNGMPGFSGQPGIANGQGAPAAPNANGNAAPNGRPLPSIVIGSLMSIGGQQLGNDRGMVHLTVNGTTRMLEVVEWTASSAKVKVPADLPAGAQAQLEIIRADGSVVTKDQVQLAAGQKLAGN